MLYSMKTYDTKASMAHEHIEDVVQAIEEGRNDYTISSEENVSVRVVREIRQEMNIRSLRNER